MYAQRDCKEQTQRTKNLILNGKRTPKLHRESCSCISTTCTGYVEELKLAKQISPPFTEMGDAGISVFTLALNVNNISSTDSLPASK